MNAPSDVHTGVRTTVILPALNEADALPAALSGRPDGLDVLVVDNGSTDGTARVAARLGARVVTEPRRGFGAACWAGVLASPGADVLVFMDADATFAWSDVPAVVAPVLDGVADLTIGWRHPRLREPGAMPWHIAAANRVLGRLCGVVAGAPLRDIGPLRAIRRDTLLSLGMQDRSYGWPLEMVLRAGRAGLTVTEVPVRYRRRVGTSKVTGDPRATLRAASRMLGVLGRFTAGRAA